MTLYRCSRRRMAFDETETNTGSERARRGGTTGRERDSGAAKALAIVSSVGGPASQSRHRKRGKKTEGNRKRGKTNGGEARSS